MTTDMTVAKTILAQLGGNRFVAMTGAKKLTSEADGLSFRLPGGGGFCKDEINYVKVSLNAEDTYDLLFLRMRGVEFKVIAEPKSVYAENLQEVFTRVTGLHTSLGTQGRR